MAEEIKRAIRLGRPSDFKITSDVISQHEKLKKQVIDILKKLSEKSEGLVIEKIKQEMWSTGGKIAGMGMVIGFGLTSIILVSNPVAAIGGMVIGYAVIAGSKWYEMRCSEAHVEKLFSIQTELEAELNRYTESKEKVFREMDMYDVFEAGKDFEENLDAIKILVRNAEKQAQTNFANIKAFLNKLENSYNKLDDDKKNKLNSKTFLMTVGSLLSVRKDTSYIMEDIADMSTAVGIIGDVVLAAPWWEIIQGLNIIINAYWGLMDIAKFYKLNKMRQDWNNGDQARLDLLENTKFNTEIKMRDFIVAIRDTILKDEYEKDN